jgi:hypothetical protein
MDTQDDKAKSRSGHAAAVLRKLDEIGAIKLDVLLAKSSEISVIAGVSLDDDDGHQMCYPNYIRIGPRSDIDIVSVAAQLKQLGFNLTRAGAQTKA